MTTNYSAEIEKVFHNVVSPYRALVVDMVEHYTPDFLELRIYQPNIDAFNQRQKIEIAQYLYRLRDSIRLCDVQCEILGVQNSPPDRAVLKRARENLKQQRGE